ncbi:hypothetical protein RHMOL_Rhmol01G0179900 [Rhododendron molle]|uniref:Uncharacterized protein n=1 Tax=Rhododendron molle TaxID=49168 RepID=A0ACC0Q499_RHOML|nr:hypothetical protein RHMOL_Rhmol01G0179900 [Rhododendron molle]
MFSMPQIMCVRLENVLDVSDNMSFSAFVVGLLQAWWESFTPGERSWFEATFGSIFASILVTIPEEGKKPRTALSVLIGLKKNSIEVEDVHGISTVTVDFLLGLYGAGLFNPNTPQFMGFADNRVSSRWHINALAFILIAGVFFPRDDGLLDMRVAFYVEAIWNHHTIIPAILAETYRSLTAFKFMQTQVVGGVELLFTWLSSIVPYFGGRVVRQFGANQNISITDSDKDSEKYRKEFSASYIPPLVGIAIANWNRRIRFNPGEISNPPGVSPNYLCWIEAVIATEDRIQIPVQLTGWIGPIAGEAYARWIESQASTYTMLSLDCQRANFQFRHERDVAVRVREETQKSLEDALIERDATRVVLEGAELELEQLREKLLDHEEIISSLSVALETTRASAGSTSTLSHLEESLSQVTLERDTLVQELSSLQHDLDALRSSSGTWQGKIDMVSHERDSIRDEKDVLESRVQHIESLLVRERQQADCDRGYYGREINRLRHELAFVATLYPRGQLDANMVQSLLGTIQHLRDLDTSGGLSGQELFERYRDALFHFHELLDSLLRGDGSP